MSASLLSAFAAGELPELAWLDGGPNSASALGRRPLRTVRGDSLAALDEVEAAWRAEPSRGWIGWVSYELGAATVLGRPLRSTAVPHLCLRQFQLERWDRAKPEGSGGAASPWPLEPLAARTDPERYRGRVRAALAHIRAGDTYQVNLSQRLRAGWTEAALALPLSRRIADVYAHLRRATPAAMGALIAVGPQRALVSNSPETLVDVRLGAAPAGGDLARSWPIKGTRPRHREPAADQAAAAALCASEKDQAEHVMIVDLVRADLGELARAGTVRAPRTPTLVSLPTVHHLVSEVSCVLRPGWSLRGLFAALYPGGSITGAPKRRTMQIIDVLEDEARGIYCGAIVLLDATGLRVSIPIRTGVLDEVGLELRSGGGVVYDSDPEAERLETLVKARAFDALAW